ncbi:NGG1p interacting factor NIF3 [bacterium]
MKLRDLFKEIIEVGKNYDPRGKEGVKRELDNRKKAYDKMSEKEKRYYDADKLDNPYSDSKIYNGKGDEEIKTIAIGVDMETPELLLIDRMKEKGMKIDAVMTHHPEGTALLSLNEVMYMQADVIHKFGVPINVADGVLKGRINDVAKGLLPINYDRAVKAAKLLDIPYFGAHTPCDNCVATYLQDKFNDKKPYTVGEVINLLMEEEEYKMSFADNNGPRVVVGSKTSRAGKVFVDMTGGTEGSSDMLAKLADSGVGTIVGMHMSKDHLKKAEANHINVVIAGHMASDAVGMNILLDSVENKLGKLEIIELSGFNRIRRVK